MNNNGYFGIQSSGSNWFGELSKNKNSIGNDVGIAGQAIGGALSAFGAYEQAEQYGNRANEALNNFNLINDRADLQIGQAKSQENINDISNSKQSIAGYNQTLLRSVANGTDIKNLGAALTKSFVDAQNQQWLNEVQFELNKTNSLFQKYQSSNDLYQNINQLEQQQQSGEFNALISGVGTVAGLGLLLL